MLRVNIFNSIGDTLFFEATIQALQSSGISVQSINSLTDSQYRDSAVPGWKKFASSFLRQPARIKKSLALSQPDTINLVTTNPFFAPNLCLRYSRNPTIAWFYDLYPDALLAAGMKLPALAVKFFSSLTARVIQKSAASVFLGSRILSHAQAQYGQGPLSTAIPLGADSSPFPDLAIHPPADKLQILYCGNLGRLHDWLSLAQLLRSQTPELLQRAEFRFHSSGKSYRKLQHYVTAAGLPPNVFLGNPLAGPAWAQAMRNADIALVSAIPGAERVSFPSKTFSSLVAGQAILALCPLKSDLADLVQDHDAGWVITPGKVEEIRLLLSSAIRNRDELHQKRQNAFTAGHERFSIKVISQRWVELFHQVTRIVPSPAPVCV